MSSRKASWCPGPGSAWEASRCRRKGGRLRWAPVPPATLPSTQGCILSPALSSVSPQQSRLGSPGKAGAAPGLGGTYTLPGHSPSPWGRAELTSGSAPDAPCLAQTAELVEGGWQSKFRVSCPELEGAQPQWGGEVPPISGLPASTCGAGAPASRPTHSFNSGKHSFDLGLATPPPMHPSGVPVEILLLLGSPATCRAPFLCPLITPCSLR